MPDEWLLVNWRGPSISIRRCIPTNFFWAGVPRGWSEYDTSLKV
jgi:hypothetical protein